MSQGWELRDGRKEDVEAMYALDLLCFSEPFRFDLRSMRQFVTRRGAIVVVAEGSDSLAGFVVVHLIRQGHSRAGYIVTLDVAPESRQQGLASTLIAAAEARSADRGAGAMVLHVFTGNAAAIRFYARAGYVEQTHVPNFYGAERHAWIYAKSLL